MLLRRGLMSHSFAIVFIAFLSFACNKNVQDSIDTSKLSIAEKIASSKEFSLFQAAIVKTSMQSKLDSLKTYTLFAPTDEIMISSGMSMDRMNAMSIEQLGKIVKYHILPTRLFLDDFKMGIYYNETTLGGDTSFMTRNEQGLYINGIKFLQTDILQRNGVIHIPSKLLMPAEGDLVEVMAVDTSLTIFNAALSRTAYGGTDLINALVCGCKFTVFAPSNDAFKLAGYPTIASIESADYKKVVGLLSYHISKERVFTSDWTNQMTVHMINGRQVQIIQSGNEMMLKGEANLMPIKVLKHNTMAYHGVIHTIERILE
jgi:uncharacterized surface protein with fasciclin (FAS1) repeats